MILLTFDSRAGNRSMAASRVNRLPVGREHQVDKGSYLKNRKHGVQERTLVLALRTNLSSARWPVHDVSRRFFPESYERWTGWCFPISRPR